VSQGLIDPPHVLQVQSIEQLLLDLIDVLSVLLGEHNGSDSGSLGR